MEAGKSSWDDWTFLLIMYNKTRVKLLTVQNTKNTFFTEILICIFEKVNVAGIWTHSEFDLLPTVVLILVDVGWKKRRAGREVDELTLDLHLFVRVADWIKKWLLVLDNLKGPKKSQIHSLWEIGLSQLKSFHFISTPPKSCILKALGLKSCLL